MSHMPIALLLAFCALFAAVSGQTLVGTCEVRVDFYSGSTCSGSSLACSATTLNSSSCEGLSIGGNFYYTSANCTAMELDIFTGADCSTGQVATIDDGGCTELSGYAIHASFNDDCGSAASLKNWLGALLFF